MKYRHEFTRSQLGEDIRRYKLGSGRRCIGREVCFWFIDSDFWPHVCVGFLSIIFIRTLG